MTKPKTPKVKAPEIRFSWCTYCGHKVQYTVGNEEEIQDAYLAGKVHDRYCEKNPLVQDIKTLQEVVDDQHTEIIKLKKGKWYQRSLGIALSTGIALHYTPVVDWFGQVILSLILWWILQKLFDWMYESSK